MNSQTTNHDLAQAARALLDCCDGLPIDTDEATAAALTAFDRTRSRLRKALAAQQEPVAAPQQGAAPGALANPRLPQQLRNMASGSTGASAQLMREAAVALDRLTAPSASGTPEAPTHCDPAEGFCKACREQKRAAQLDGGQEGSAT